MYIHAWLYLFYVIADNEFWSLLQRRQQSSASIMSDVYDEAEYSKHCQPGGFLCRHTNPANVSFTLNTDRASLFHSSINGIWPVYLAINELPPAARCSSIIVTGFYTLFLITSRADFLLRMYCSVEFGTAMVSSTCTRTLSLLTPWIDFTNRVHDIVFCDEVMIYRNWSFHPRWH